MKNQMNKHHRGSMLCVIAFAIGCICAFAGCRTTHHFKTETLKHSSYNTDTITLEVAEW